MDNTLLESAIESLRMLYAGLDWTLYHFSTGDTQELMYKWPGAVDEEIMVCVHNYYGYEEPFHRHDYFYFNYTYKGKYDSLSYKYDNQITICENELYAGQPLAGHALKVHSNQEAIIIGVLIKKDVIFRSFLPMLAVSSKFFHFLLDPSTKAFSEEYIHMKVENDRSLRTLLEIIVIEYASGRERTQEVLMPLCLSMLVLIARQYDLAHSTPTPEKRSDQIMKYISEHFDNVTLNEISEKFYYHPNYISNLLSREFGKSFSQILLDQRMQRALMLMKGSNLSLEEISNMIGYSSSNFFKAFKAVYGESPREYIKKHIENQPAQE